MIELKGVSKSIRRDRSCSTRSTSTIAQGQTTALIGPSGCGKSTLLRLMIGLVQPDAGSVAIANTELNPATMLEVRHGLGYVIQDGGLFPAFERPRQRDLDGPVPGLGNAADPGAARPVRRADALPARTASTGSQPSSRAVSASA